MSKISLVTIFVTRIMKILRTYMVSNYLHKYLETYFKEKHSRMLTTNFAHYWIDDGQYLANAFVFCEVLH